MLYPVVAQITGINMASGGSMGLRQTQGLQWQPKPPDIHTNCWAT